MRLRRLWFRVHRYVGLVCLVIMLLWSLSGVVMMYQGYPRQSAEEQLATLAPLSLARCCETPQLAHVEDQITQLVVEMLDDRPTLHLYWANGERQLFDLTHGTGLPSISPELARKVARRYLGRDHLPPAEVIARDQWTVYGSYNPHRPLYRFSVDDAAATELYVSSRTGQIVQETTRSERLWGYLGAVTHWIYPTLLRQHVSLWYWLVVVLSVLGTLLTATGLYVGWVQLRRRRSPYRGWHKVHHYSGLIFGVLTLTWVASGLLSMNPGGLLEADRGAAEKTRWRGTPTLDLPAITAQLAQVTVPEGTVRLRWLISDAFPAVLAERHDGPSERLNANSLLPEPLAPQQLPHSARRLAGADKILSQSLIHREDSYYYSHHKHARLPVYRVVLASGIRYYLHPQTGALLKKVDGNARWYRWLFNGLHSLDFFATLRSRPVWDLVMLLALSGVTLLCVSGVYIGYKRAAILKRSHQARKHRA